MRKTVVIFFLCIVLAVSYVVTHVFRAYSVEGGKTRLFPIQSIDTMKYSRDIAREKLHDASFDKHIDTQVKNIAATGATHIAIATPYDEEFIPFLTRWVRAARKYNLNVWFRGNFSGWEEWFDYPEITKDEHIRKTKAFIARHADMFVDNDLFSACPECENGALGDPRQTGRLAEYRQFLIDEYQVTTEAFNRIGKRVQSNILSMNGDVARLVMDRETTRELGGMVTIDHYVETPEQLVGDAERIAGNSGGLVMLGEFGTPIPDIHGELTEDQQAMWVGAGLYGLAKSKSIAGVNYWTNKGSSTALWNDDDTPRAVVSTITDFYKPLVIRGTVRDELGFLLSDVTVTSPFETVHTKTGAYRVFFITGDHIEFQKPGYINVSESLRRTDVRDLVLDVTMQPTNPSLLYKILLPILRRK
ncbi:MAG: hypothetical protein WC775_02085 [Patescibacteria group bacterium]|jgi:hypothetical protein